MMLFHLQRMNLRSCQNHKRHCRQHVTGWRAGRLDAACLNSLCQSVWAVHNPPGQSETVQAYHYRKVEGARALETTLTMPRHNQALMGYFRQAGVSLITLRHLLRTRPDRFKQNLRHHQERMHARQNHAA